MGIGGDPVNGTSHLDVIEMFNDDPETKGIIMIGEIGGSAERKPRMDQAALQEAGGRVHRGATAPPDDAWATRAIVSGGKGTAAAKIAAFKEAGIGVAPTPVRNGGYASRDDVVPACFVRTSAPPDKTLRDRDRNARRRQCGPRPGAPSTWSNG